MLWIRVGTVHVCMCTLFFLYPPIPDLLLQVVSELEGKDINEVISEGMGKLASMPSGEAYLSKKRQTVENSLLIVWICNNVYQVKWAWCTL